MTLWRGVFATICIASRIGFGFMPQVPASRFALSKLFGQITSAANAKDPGAAAVRARVLRNFDQYVITRSFAGIAQLARDFL